MSQSKAKRARIDALRAEQAKQRAAQARRKRMMIIAAPIALVVVIVLVMVVIKTTSNNKNSGATAASAAVVSKLTSIPASELNQYTVSSTVAKSMLKVSGKPALTAGGLPRVVYIGAEYCPYCAAERWPFIVALSRFGTFTGLQEIKSSGTDVYPNTPTWTFVKAKYTSSYVSLSTYETEDVNEKPLQTPPSSDEALLKQLDAPPYVSASNAGSIPFIDFGNKGLILGASYSPQSLAGLTQAQIVNDLRNPNSAVAKAALPVANLITAQVCQLTGNKPTTVCGSATISAIEKQL
jgi:hypothetical protein